MIVHVVIKCGIYRHEIFGVYRSEKKARKAAECMLRLEPDDYHTADIVEVDLDKDAPKKEVLPQYKIESPWSEKVIDNCKRKDTPAGITLKWDSMYDETL